MWVALFGHYLARFVGGSIRPYLARSENRLFRRICGLIWVGVCSVTGSNLMFGFTVSG